MNKCKEKEKEPDWEWQAKEEQRRRQEWYNTPLMKRTSRESGIEDVEDDDGQPF
jgi:hypothetical protein